jgi:hypothetical protein
VSIHDERELRERLTGLMGDLEPRPAPVDRAIRQGRGIRVRRWISAALGIGVIALAAIVLPGLVRPQPVHPATPRHYRVTVVQLGGVAKGGLIGAGTMDGKRWRVILQRALGDGCAVAQYTLTCGTTNGGDPGARQVSLEDSTDGSTQFELGTVGAKVTRVVIQLTNGSELDVRPVSAYGRRWIAVAAPTSAIRRAESFVGAAEYAYAIPFADKGIDDFVTWLRPGQPGLPRASRSLGSGDYDGAAWHAAISAGPWGYCAVFAAGSGCVPGTSIPRLVPPRDLFGALFCGPLYTSSGKPAGASSGVAAVPSGVRYVVLRFAGGKQQQMTTVTVAGTTAFVFVIPSHQKIIGALEFSPARQLVHSGLNPTLGC